MVVNSFSCIGNGAVAVFQAHPAGKDNAVLADRGDLHVKRIRSLLTEGESRFLCLRSASIPSHRSTTLTFVPASRYGP